jgi:ABC-type lipoprotein release transport system permease subunit
MSNKDISSLDVYGIVNGLLLSGNRHVPVYLLSSLQTSSQLFINKNFEDKNKFYCGNVLFKKYHILENKKLAIITHEDKKKKSLFFDAMPIAFYQGYNFGWDDWNEKAIVIPVEKIENYFEIPTIEFIHVNINNKNKIKEVFFWIQEKLANKINYIDFGVKVLPEYNKCLILLTIISNGVSILIFIFSFFLLLILINLYLYQNKEEFYCLVMIGIKKKYIQISIIIFFLLLGLLSLLAGFLLGYCIITAINFFRCIPISVELENFFYCVINWNTLFLYFIVYIVILLLSVWYYYQKYAFHYNK